MPLPMQRRKCLSHALNNEGCAFSRAEAPRGASRGLELHFHNTHELTLMLWDSTKFQKGGGHLGYVACSSSVHTRPGCLRAAVAAAAGKLGRAGGRERPHMICMLFSIF